MTPSTTAGRASENSQSSKTSEPQTNPTPEPTFPLITLTPSPSSDIPEWADRALNAATFLWSLVDCNIHPLADSPKDAATADKPNEIRTCIDKINRFINGALNGLNPTQSGHGKASAAPDEGLRNALLALTNRIRAQEALRELKNLPHSQNTPNPKQTSSKLQREATNNRSPSPTPTNPPKPPKPSIQVPDLRFQGNPPLWRSASTTRATNKINSALNKIQETEGKLAAIAAIARPNGNYVVTFSGDSNPQLAGKHKDILSKALAPVHPTALVKSRHSQHLPTGRQLGPGNGGQPPRGDRSQPSHEGRHNHTRSSVATPTGQARRHARGGGRNFSIEFLAMSFFRPRYALLNIRFHETVHATQRSPMVT
jgi:hypothetical protein